jgi:GrpB-like predicted nucleotidyltransferase (UPF0157 family)
VNVPEEEIVRFAPEQTFRDSIARRFDEVRARLEVAIPDAEILHVGSTAVPGSLTKGDLDIQVRVSAEQFASVREKLAGFYAVNEGGFSGHDAISFEDYGSDPHVGVHLTVRGGSGDVQAAFRDLLLASEALRQEYDELKRAYDGDSMEEYRLAKAEFVSRVLFGYGVQSEATAPRWLQFAAGLVLLPITLISVVGAVSILGVPKVQGDPLLQLFAGVIIVACTWTVLIAARLLMGIRGRYGLLGPTALRIAAAAAIALVIGGAFTGFYVEQPFAGGLMAIAYIAISIRLWRLAAYRASRPGRPPDTPPGTPQSPRREWPLYAGSVMRLAFGPCTCSRPQADALSRAMCGALMARVNSLRELSRDRLQNLASYSTTVERIEGRTVRFEEIREVYPGTGLVIVVRVFVRTWARPNWITLNGAWRMFANGFIVGEDDDRRDAPDEIMWSFR